MEIKKHPYNPWYKATYTYEAQGLRLPLRVPHDVFSTQRIDEGTILLLQNLAASEPRSVLDMGCGYGALGLPLAAKHPQARFDLVDRDLLAAAWSADNARANGLGNVNAFGSLGFLQIEPGKKYDWILCNVPARIGEPFIRNLIEGGRARLNPGGDLRLVVIHDLCAVVQKLATEAGCPVQEIKRGERHTVYAFGPSDSKIPQEDLLELYGRDQVEFAGIQWHRPFDLGGDDPKRLKQGLPLLLDALPRDPKQAPKRVLCFRTGYGILPLLSRQRWPEATVVSVDRDLLGEEFIKINAQKLGLGGAQLELRPQAHFPDALKADEKFDLVVGEISPSAGDQVALAEMRAIQNSLAPGGQALLLCLDKLEKEWLKVFAERHRMKMIVTMKREGYSIIRL